MVKLFNGVPCRLVHDLQQRLLLLQHLSPLDLDLNGLALACGRHSGLLQHGCTDPQPSSVNTTRPQAPSQEASSPTIWGPQQEAHTCCVWQHEALALGAR